MVPVQPLSFYIFQFWISNCVPIIFVGISKPRYWYISIFLYNGSYDGRVLYKNIVFPHSESLKKILSNRFIKQFNILPAANPTNCWYDAVDLHSSANIQLGKKIHSTQTMTGYFEDSLIITNTHLSSLARLSVKNHHDAVGFPEAGSNYNLAGIAAVSIDPRLSVVQLMESFQNVR